MSVAARLGAPCDVCGTEVAPGLLSCPGCQRLVHADALKALAAQAAAAAEHGDAPAELDAWRASLDLIPPHARQYAQIVGKVDALSRAVASTGAAPPPPESGAWKWLAGLGTAGLALWKLKALILLLLTKGKLLIFGLTKASTLFSMLLSMGVYATAWGVWFAVGVVLSIYVHEMGHVFALRTFGVPASAPMFVPGLGAFVRMRQAPLTPHVDARVGLAGPQWGLVAAIAAYAGGVTAGPMWTAIAHTGAWLNLFNLLPVWHLDGSRAFSALSRAQRWMAVTAIMLGWLISHDGLLPLLAIVAVVRAVGDAPEEADHGVLAWYAGLVLALSAIVRLSAS